MTDPQPTDRDLQRLFAARVAGAIDPALAARIGQATRATRQRSGLTMLPTGPMRALALAASVGAIALAGASLLVASGGPGPRPSPNVPLPSDAPPPTAAPPSTTPTRSSSPTPSPTPSPTASPTPHGQTLAGGLGYLTRPTDLVASPALGATVIETLDPTTTRVWVMEGPREADGAIWWKVLPFAVVDTRPAAHQSGWLMAGYVATDEPSILGYLPGCPVAPIDLLNATSLPFDPFDGIPCFGHDEVTINGHLTCSEADAEGPTSGPDWLGQPRSCTFETIDGQPLMGVYGDAVFGLVPGNGIVVRGIYAVTGHWDDPQASLCTGTGREGEPTDDVLQLGCRALFVATSVAARG